MVVPSPDQWSIFEMYDGTIDNTYYCYSNCPIYMVLIVKCFYLLFLQTPSLYKYYKFRNGPPTNWDKLCAIFDGSMATGKLRYASTQSPPSASSDRHVDLSIPPAIVHLTKPRHPCSQQVSRGKGKGKRHASSTHSLQSSKHSSSIGPDSNGYG
jgi:hypothetical protein